MISHARRTLRRCLVALGVLGVLALPECAAAQRITSTLDLGGSGISYVDSGRTSAISVGPAMQMNFDRATLGASGSFAKLASGGWTTQGGIGASLYTPAAGPFVGELSGSAGGSAHAYGGRTGQSLALVRGHLMTPRRGLWVGGGAGNGWDGTTSRALVQAEAAAWSRLGGSAIAIATLTPTTVGDTLRYSDAEFAVRWDGVRLEAGATAGGRRGRGPRAASAGTATWGSASLTAWLSSRTAIVGSAGTYPIDLTQGFPGGRFVSVALRLGSRSARRDGELAAREPARPPDAAEAGPVRGFAVVAAPQGGRTIRVLAPSAGVVELTGDFSDWSPVRLARSADGWWTVTLPLAAGTHQVNVRLDGGAWLVPPTLNTLRDEFGGEVGLLVVP